MCLGNVNRVFKQVGPLHCPIFFMQTLPTTHHARYAYSVGAPVWYSRLIVFLSGTIGGVAGGVESNCLAFSSIVVEKKRIATSLDASEWPDTTIPLVPYTGDRASRTPAKTSVVINVLLLAYLNVE